jgi:hypothetical protein
MKIFLTIASCFFSIMSFSQEVNLGGGIGTDQGLNTFGLHSYVEFRPNKAPFSLNVDPSVHFYGRNPFYTVPVYLKFIIGNKFRVCPSFGLFLGSSTGNGWMTNLNFEFVTAKKIILTAQASLSTDYWKTDQYLPGGVPYVSSKSEKWLWINIGIKKMLVLKGKNPPPSK